MTKAEKKKIQAALTYAREVVDESLSSHLDSYCAYDENTGAFTDESRFTADERMDVDRCRKALKKITKALEVLA